MSAPGVNADLSRAITESPLIPIGEDIDPNDSERFLDAE